MGSSLFQVEFQDWGMQIMSVPQVKYTSAYYFYEYVKQDSYKVKIIC